MPIYDTIMLSNNLSKSKKPFSLASSETRALNFQLNGVLVSSMFVLYQCFLCAHLKWLLEVCMNFMNYVAHRTRLTSCWYAASTDFYYNQMVLQTIYAFKDC